MNLTEHTNLRDFEPLSSLQKRLKCCIALAGLLLLGITSGQAAAAEVPTYALLSLVGDRMEIVVNANSTGSHLDRNRREEPIAVNTDIFDGVVVTVAAQAVARSVPGAALAALNTRSPVLFANQHDLFRVQDGRVAWPQAIGAALAAQQATHLILVTKQRGATDIQFEDTSMGSGSLEGLGFYVDASPQVLNVETGKKRFGVVAAFFYARLALIEVASGRLISAKTITAARAIDSSRPEAGAENAWDAMSPVEKVNALRSLIQAEVERAAPLLFKPQ